MQSTLHREVPLAGPPEGDAYIAREKIEEVEGGERKTNTEITVVVQRNMHPKYSELLVAVVTAVGTLLLTLTVQVYLYQ